MPGLRARERTKKSVGIHSVTRRGHAKSGGAPSDRLTSESSAVILVASSTSDAIAAGAMASTVRCLVLRCSAAEHEASRDGLWISSGSLIVVQVERMGEL